MTYGTKRFKNGKWVGYLHFGTGKKVFLSPKELMEFEEKIRYWASEGVRHSVIRN